MKTKNDVFIRIRRKIKLFIFGILAYNSNLFKYIRYSNSNYWLTERNFIYIITVSSHVIEKGLSMPDSRLGFGHDRLLQLIEDLIWYVHLGFSISNVQFQNGCRVVDEYINRHISMGYDLQNDILSAYTELRKISEVSVNLEYNDVVSGNSYFLNVKSTFDVFSWSRHSLRNFSSESVDIQNIRKAVELARNTPTPCNRQTNKTYVIKDKTIINDILKLQGGARGFGHLGDKLLIITSDVSGFNSIMECNEVYKTGGMYAMNLLYALHFYSVGACTLQWGEQPEKEKSLRKIVNIPLNEYVIMMILVGNPPRGDFRIALSQRNPLEDSLIEIS